MRNTWTSLILDVSLEKESKGTEGCRPKEVWDLGLEDFAKKVARERDRRT
jgi:hypothetical protein